MTTANCEAEAANCGGTSKYHRSKECDSGRMRPQGMITMINDSCMSEEAGTKTCGEKIRERTFEGVRPRVSLRAETKGEYIKTNGTIADSMSGKSSPNDGELRGRSKRTIVRRSATATVSLVTKNKVFGYLLSKETMMNAFASIRGLRSVLASKDGRS